MSTRRLYYDDSYQQNFEARVLSCLPGEPVQGASGMQPSWEVLLDQTSLYPSSGGQPNDLGLLGEAVVLDVRDDGDEIVHIVDRELDNGPVNGCVNWPRRFDHMQQHTGQHLLSAMFHERFGLPTVSFHLGTDFCTIDLRGEEPSSDHLLGAQRAANRVIFEDRPVNVRYGTAEQLARIGVRKEVDRAGLLRAIEIETADLQPCGGTHVKSAGQIGMILVRGCSKVRQDWRVEFVCGGRAERAATQDRIWMRAIAERLGGPPEDSLEAVEKALADRDSSFKNMRGVLQSLAEARALLMTSAAAPAAGGIRVLAEVIEDAPAELLPLLATEIAKHEGTVALLILAENGQLVFAQHPAAGKDLQGVLKEVFAAHPGKGGGTRDFVRAKIAEPAQCEAALRIARRLVEGSHAV
jgi:alanyl-tRNA synthetase